MKLLEFTAIWVGGRKLAVLCPQQPRNRITLVSRTPARVAGCNKHNETPPVVTPVTSSRQETEKWRLTFC